MSGRCPRCKGNLYREHAIGPAAADPVDALVCLQCGETQWGESRIDAFRRIADTVQAGQRGRPRKQQEGTH